MLAPMRPLKDKPLHTGQQWSSGAMRLGMLPPSGRINVAGISETHIHQFRNAPHLTPSGLHDYLATDAANLASGGKLIVFITGWQSHGQQPIGA